MGRQAKKGLVIRPAAAAAAAGPAIECGFAVGGAWSWVVVE